MKLGINKPDLSKAFIARNREISAVSKDRDKKKHNEKDFKRKSTKVSYTSLFDDFNSVDIIG